MISTSSDLQPHIVCLSHLRWNFVFQRPQHLLSRFAPALQVSYVEEPVIIPGITARLRKEAGAPGVTVLVPELGSNYEIERQLRTLLRQYLTDSGIEDYLLWYYTPLAQSFTEGLNPRLVIYDCMDELSLFAGADSRLPALDRQLLASADLVFTGGVALYEWKAKVRKSGIFPFPSSIDFPHFAKAREPGSDPSDQAQLRRPRMGFFGVIDERLDLQLIAQTSALLPDWEMIMIGPVVKIPEASLPRHPNIHYLGPKRYAELPEYLRNWDVAILPFANNSATRFISPTKTPEYLAGGCPVVSTRITDVVRPYAELRLVDIAESAEDFATAVVCSQEKKQDEHWRYRVNAFLRTMSWDKTFAEMKDLIFEALQHRRQKAA